MPSIGTSILSARVKDETLNYFKLVAEEYGTTVPKILDAMAWTQPDPTGAVYAFRGRDDER